jgi:hypothetical protein
MTTFKADCLPVLIGSVPHKNHRQAVDLIFGHTGQIPLWPQLPHFRDEGMLLQFLPGMPGVVKREDKTFIDTSGPDFEQEFLSFFEDYLLVVEGEVELERSRFAMGNDAAPGFGAFLETAKERADELVTLKGQLTGPITFCTGLVDQDGRALFYDEQIRDAAVKLLALRARDQTRKMAVVKPQPLVFFDEPGLAGFGSSAFITITPQDINDCLCEVFEGVTAEGGLTGIHVCANTEWSVIFDTGVDIVSFDAYSYFEKLILFSDHLVSFLNRGGILASGIVPTSAELLDTETSQSLVDRWSGQLAQLEALGVPRSTVISQTLITPSCGTGTVSEVQAQRVFQLTSEVSAEIRDRYLR